MGAASMMSAQSERDGRADSCRKVVLFFATKKMNRAKNKQMDTLPDDLWQVIIAGRYSVYWRLALAVPKFGRLTLRSQDHWRQLFSAVINYHNSKIWTLAGRPHRDGGLPAVVGERLEWRIFGKLHRGDDLPAVVQHGQGHADGATHREWWVHGKHHRIGAPATISTSIGVVEWWQDGYLHRDDNLPAVSVAGVYDEWYIHGVARRTDGGPVVVNYQ